MKIRDLLNEKGYDVVTVPPSFPIPDAMRLLVEHNIGSVVVAQDKVGRGNSHRAGHSPPCRAGLGLHGVHEGRRCHDQGRRGGAPG